MPAALQGLQLPRVTLAGMLSSTPGESTRVADRVFTCRDDVTFFQFSRDGRPHIGPDHDKNNVPSPATDGNGVFDLNEFPDAAIVQGDYSYLVMVTPAESENPYPRQPVGSPPDYVKKVALDQRRLYTVQVVVFHKRDLGVDTTVSPIPAPAERQIHAFVSSNSALLRPPPANPEYVRGLAPNQWIMLSAYAPPPNDPIYGAPNNGDESRLVRPIHRWVRIISVGKGTTPGDVQVNFAGPDWTGLTMSLGSAAVTIADTVVGVHERTVQLDARSLTAQ
jgi:hypothetical protein